MEERRLTCGYCRYGGDHEHCPGGVYSNGKVYVCDCGCEQSKVVKCINCGFKHPTEVGNWYCIDKDSCDARINKSRNKIKKISEI